MTAPSNTATDRVAVGLDQARHPARPTPPADPATQHRVEAALRALPSHSWVGRRDRALLVLSHHAGIPYREIAGLTRADVAVCDSAAIINTRAGALMLQPQPDGRLCGPCGLARWMHVLDLTVVYSHAVITAILARSVPITARSPHLCEGKTSRTDDLAPGLLFPPIDPWGGFPVPSGPAGEYRVAGINDLEQRALALEHRGGLIFDNSSSTTAHRGTVEGRT